MAILTDMARFGRAKAFVDANASGTWVGFGRITTDWAGDPTAPTGAETTLSETGCYKLCDVVTYIIEDPDASADYITYNGVRWRKILEAEALSEKCRWVLVSATLTDDESGLLEDFSFRQIGVSTGIVPGASYIGRTLLRTSGFGAGAGATEDEYVLTNEVLHVIDNVVTTTHKTSYEDTAMYIIQF